MIHNAPSTENPNIHVNDFTRELFGFEVTQGSPRSGVGFTYSPWKSMMEGKEGYENIMRKVRVWLFWARGGLNLGQHPPEY